MVLGRNEETVQEIVVDRVLDGVKAQRIQGVGGRFEDVDFLRRELVIDTFVPVGHAFGRVIEHSLRLDSLLPVAPGLSSHAPHQEPPPWADAPNPPREDPLCDIANVAGKDIHAGRTVAERTDSGDIGMAVWIGTAGI